MQATGMIIDLVNNVAECKHLNCPPLTIDFRRTLNHDPVMYELRANDQVHKVALFNHVVKEIENLERFHEAKVQAGGSKIIPQNLAVHFGSKSVAPPATCDKDCDDSGSDLFSDHSSDVEEDFGSRWVSPNSVNEDDDYHSSVLKKVGYL